MAGVRAPEVDSPLLRRSPDVCVARRFMSAGKSFFVDSKLLLYYVNPGDTLKQDGRRSGSASCGWPERVVSWQVLDGSCWNAARKMRRRILVVCGPARNHAREVQQALDHAYPLEPIGATPQVPRCLQDHSGDRWPFESQGPGYVIEGPPGVVPAQGHPLQGAIGEASP